MADLDDFFAKKDKKKKTKKGFAKANTEVLAKTLEEKEQQEKRAEAENKPQLVQQSNGASEVKEEGAEGISNSETGGEAAGAAAGKTNGGVSNLRVYSSARFGVQDNAEMVMKATTKAIVM